MPETIKMGGKGKPEGKKPQIREEILAIIKEQWEDKDLKWLKSKKKEILGLLKKNDINDEEGFELKKLLSEIIGLIREEEVDTPQKFLEEIGRELDRYNRVVKPETARTFDKEESKKLRVLKKQKRGYKETPKTRAELIAELRKEFETERRRLEELERELMEIRRENCGAKSEASEQHQERNEDSFIALPETGGFALADGVSGNKGGEVASKISIDILKKHLSSLSKDSSSKDEVEGALKKAVLEANEEILKQRQETPALRNMATTLTAIQIFRDEDGEPMLAIAHVGDSRAYILKENGVLEQITEDETQAYLTLKNDPGIGSRKDQIIKKLEEATEEGALTEEEKRVFDLQNRLLNYLGLKGLDTKIKFVSLRGADKILLATDGISDPLTKKLLCDILKTIQTPQEIAEDIIELAKLENKKGGLRAKADDKTAIVINI